MLHVVFALDRGVNLVVKLVPYESLQAVSRRKTLHLTCAMLPRATRQIDRHSQIESAVRPIRHSVDPATSHSPSFSIVGGRDKPGHDAGELFGRSPDIIPRALHP